MICFVSNQKPHSIQATGCQKYKERLKNEFSNIASLYPSLPLNEALYSKLIYIHVARTDIDVDNMSKPFVDAFNSIIYIDDAIINHRVCSKIKFDDLSAYELQLDLLPDEIAEKLDDLITTKSPHILYFEVDSFSPDMVFVGGSKNET